MVNEIQAANDAKRQKELQSMQTYLQKEYTAKLIEQQAAVTAHAEALLEAQRQQILQQAEANHQQVLSSRIKELEDHYNSKIQSDALEAAA